MYQSVEEPHGSALEDESAQAARRIWRVAGLVAAVLILLTILIAILQSRSQKTHVKTPADIERSAYHTAITEPTKTLRRARLQDYIERYPESAQRGAASAQLEVLRRYENTAWSELAETVYNPNGGRAEKLSAIETYERDWASAYLGGREDELKRLKTLIGAEDDPTPDRELEDESNNIPTSIDGNIMAGGPVMATPPPVIITPAPPPPPVIVAPAPKMPKVTKNVRPQYPNRALRRNIEATVQLSLSIDRHGKVDAIHLVSVNARKYERDFVRAAFRAAKRTRYEPYRVGGVARPLSGIAKRYQFKIER